MSALRRGTDRLLELPVVYRTWQAPFASGKLRPLLANIDLARVKTVLDVGCGPGTNAAVFSHNEYVGIDINPAYIETASSRYKGRFVVGDVSDDAVFPDERFDLVLANSLMHHLDDHQADGLLQRMAQLTTTDGRVHVLDLVLPDRPSVARTMARLDRGSFPRPLDTWRRLFTRHLTEEHFEPYPLGLPGLALWQMVYFVGRPS